MQERSDLESIFIGLVTKVDSSTITITGEAGSKDFKVNPYQVNYRRVLAYARDQMDLKLSVKVRYEETPISGNRMIDFLKAPTYPVVPSPNWDSRDGAKIDTLVLHYTASENYEVTKNWFLTRNSEVSAHYVVDIDGSVYEFVKEESRAWHAGSSSTSYWDGVRGLNYNSIGIEIENKGIIGWTQQDPYPPAQVEALLKLCREICDCHNILPCNVVGHSDIAPNRKYDPGISFPWAEFAQQGFSFLPSPAEIEAEVIPEDFNFLEGLKAFGFDTSGTSGGGVNTGLITFKLHYFISEWIGDQWTVTDTNKKMVLALLRKKGSI